MADKPDLKTETKEERTAHELADNRAAVQKKYDEAPHPKSDVFTKADLALLSEASVSAILRARGKRERRKLEAQKQLERIKALGRHEKKVQVRKLEKSVRKRKVRETSR